MMAVIWGRYTLWLATALASLASIVLGLVLHNFFWLVALIAAALFFLGLSDYTQKSRGVIANYPLLGRMRYLLESIRPELRQYFWEADTDELPYSRNQRAMVYQRAKGILAARPLGTVLNIYKEDYNWLNHSIGQITDNFGKGSVMKLGQRRAMDIESAAESVPRRSANQPYRGQAGQPDDHNFPAPADAVETQSCHWHSLSSALVRDVSCQYWLAPERG